MSKCNLYSIAKVYIADQALYEAWRRRGHPAGLGLIATRLPTAELARQAAAVDHRRLQEEGEP